MDKQWKYEKIGRRIGICFGTVAMIIIPNVLAFVFDAKENRSLVEHAELDYSLVYDEESYLEHNPDIAEAMGNNSEELIKHFIDYGMDEGRIASDKFDVYYYRENNSDLAETYGEDLRQYYLHYMLYGKLEGRMGSNIISYDTALESEILDENTLRFHIETKNQELVGKSYFLFKLPAYRYEITERNYLLSGSFTNNDIEVDFKCNVRENLNEKYVLAQKTNTGYRIVSNDSYISNVEILCRNDIKKADTYSKKGLQVASIMAEDRENVMKELEVLNPSYPFTNLVIENIMYPEKADENVIIYSYKGKEYYFRENVILNYDETFAAWTARGASVTASILSVKREGFEGLYYPDILMDT